MNRAFYLLVGYLGVSVLTGCCATAKETDTWKRFTSKEGRFSIRFPGTPKVSKEKFKIDVYESEITSFTVESADGKTAYYAGYNDFSKDLLERCPIDAMFDGARDNAVKVAKGKLTRERDMKAGRYPGREVRIETAGFVIATRYFLVKQRLYTLVVSTAKEENNEPVIDQFFKLFKLN